VILAAGIVFGCAGAQVEPEEEAAPTQEEKVLTPEEYMYEQQRQMQRKFMMQNRPLRFGPGSR